MENKLPICIRNMHTQYVKYNTQNGIRNMQYAICNMQYAIYNMHTQCAYAMRICNCAYEIRIRNVHTECAYAMCMRNAHTRCAYAMRIFNLHLWCTMRIRNAHTQYAYSSKNSRYSAKEKDQPWIMMMFSPIISGLLDCFSRARTHTPCNPGIKGGYTHPRTNASTTRMSYIQYISSCNPLPP